MKDTRAKILSKSLELFNKTGTSGVTVRMIAAELEMSHGNLCYHFPNIENIIIVLFQNLTVESDILINDIMKDFKAEVINLSWLINLTERTFQQLYKYRFLLLEFVQLSKRIKFIKVEFLKLQDKRRKEFNLIFKLMQDKGYLVGEKFENEFGLLFELIMLTGNFWISESEMIFKGSMKDRISHYSRLFFHLLVPYLTEKGLIEYKAYYGVK